MKIIDWFAGIGGLQKSGKHMVMARRKREIKCEKNH